MISNLRILIVEDEPLVSMLLEDMVLDLGHVVVGPASRIEEALELAGDAAFDVAVLDLNLAGVQTYPVAAKLKARGIPFIFATGYDAGAFPDDFAGTPTLQKPFRQDGLKDAIAHAFPP